MRRMTDSYLLYGAQISYFSGKVRAYLQWKGVPFTERESDADIYRRAIVPGVGFPVIPVVRTPGGALLQDSTDIIEALEAAHPQPGTVPPGGVQRFVARLLELYGDEWLIIPAMHYRWHHNRDWAMRAFGQLNAPDASADAQFEIGQRRAQPFAQAAVLLGAQAHMHGAIERSYEALLRELDAHFAVHRCVLGDRPSIADFGLYGPLYAHQYRDPASGALMKRLAPNVVAWIERLRDGAMPTDGRFAPDDAIPPTLLPVLRRLMREQLPVLAGTIERLNAWIAEHPGEQAVPRALGMHAYELDSERGERIVRPYSLWMLQRAADAHAALSSAERERADELLTDIGGSGFTRLPRMPRLERDRLSVRLAAAG
jgi:glutathione S-transferase